MVQEKSPLASVHAAPFPYRRTASAAIAATLITALLLWQVDAHASPLLAPAVGVPDNALAGTEVAQPPTPEGALFQNPAGLAAFSGTIYSVGIGVGFGEGRIKTPAALGYDETNHPMVIVPSLGVSIPIGDRVRAGLGIFGSTGAAFDYAPASPLIKQDFFSESAITAMPLALAYRLREDLWVGAEVSPLFGYLRNRIPLPDPGSGALAQARYTLRGPGVQGMVGVTWLPSQLLSLGLGVRTPGAIWLDGSTIYGGERRDVDLVIQMPTQIFAGATVHPTSRVSVSASVRWTDSSRFEKSKVKFANVELPFVPDAQDEWRTGLGVAFGATDNLTLLGGFSYGTAIVGSAGASPLLFDSEDVKISAGASYQMGAWTLHLTGGYQFEGDRTVAADEALLLPGRYTNRGGIVLFGVQYEG